MALTKRCNSGDALPRLLQGNSMGDTIDVAIVYGPQSYYLYGDTLGGTNLDLLNAFSRHSGKVMKMWPVASLQNAMDNLEKGSFDLLASVPSDNTVKQRFATTKSIYLDHLVLIQLADSSGNVKANSALDIANDTVHIQSDSPAAARLANLANEIGSPIVVVPEKNLSEEYLCMKVAAGDFKYAVVNEKIAASMKQRYPLLNHENPVSFSQFQVWLLNKNDSTLLNEINTWLDEFSPTPEYLELIKKY